MSEGAIMLPALAIVFGGIIYIHDLYETKIDGMSEARQCALSVATSGCSVTGSADCSGSGGSLSIADQVGGVIPLLGQVINFLKRVPIIGDLIEKLDQVKSTSQQFSKTVSLPDVIGGGGAEVQDLQKYICGEKKWPQPGNLLKEIFCNLTPFC